MAEGQVIDKVRQSGEETVLFLKGRVDRTEVKDLWQEVRGRIKAGGQKRLVLDFSDVSAMDTAGTALLFSLEHLCRQRGLELDYRHLPESVNHFLQYIKDRSEGRKAAKAPPRADVITRLGDWGVRQARDAYAFVRFFGDFLLVIPKLLLQPQRLNIRDFFYQVQLAGVGAVLLLVALSLLLGALMVFQGMNSVRNFGAPVFIADLVVISVTREMAPLLTAVVLAGRSGAAFAAEIGTMKINEEIDALTVLNFDITRYLAMPRVLALMLAAPVLIMVSDAAGIFGGLATSRVVMDLPAASFLGEAQNILTTKDIYSGLVKGAAFGMAIGLIGCFRGLTTAMTPDSVGIQTTSAVVTSIFVVIVLDTLFSYLMQIY